MIDIKTLIRDIPDFPKPGILFKDITPLLKNPEAFAQSIDLLAKPYEGQKIDVVIGVESRGFIFAPMVAQKLGAGFAPVRKPGKLPYKTIEESYELEYGTDTLQIHEDAFSEGQKVLIVDDLLATGGTVSAVIKMVRRLGGQIVGCAFVIELGFLNGRKRIPEIDIHSLIHY